MTCRCLRAGALIVALLALLAVANPAAANDCFGAAARDPHVCGASAEPHTVTPTPTEARTLPNSPCVAVRGQASPPVCAFGTPADQADRTVALVGDSHAGHWRGALTQVALAKRWRGLSITHSSCPLQVAVRDLQEPRRTQCADWKRKVFAWFQAHPEVRTVFVAGLTGGSGVVPRAGKSRYATSVQSYVDAWKALPATVEHIVVIRDTPKFKVDTGACVERALRAGRDAGRACARPRDEAMDRDPAVRAAARMPADRVQTVDLTRYFCATDTCFPVVGGALVLRDNTHMTGVFSTTLGTYLLAAYDRVAPRLR